MALAAKRQRSSPTGLERDEAEHRSDHRPADAMRQQRQNELRSFLVALSERQVDDFVSSDDELFSTIVDLATSDYGVEQKKIAEHLGVSATAITRWKSGEHMPRPYARKSVISAISALVEAKLREIEINR